ncbi:MAG TPA: twin-arginine translocase subunit TatB, partial [Alphaproteobacteria bacterium]|nr:twin-arginine translocase subunit TatB [Alphaproteobacteria bacterium]
MPDIGWQELLIIGAIAIIVVGPKELPLLMRTVGRWIGRARAMAADFQRSMDDLAHETELEKLRRSINEIGD